MGAPVASFIAVTLLAIAPRRQKREAPMQVMLSFVAKIRRWLGLDRKPVAKPFSTGS
jgi:hypothetical protein